MPSMRSARPRGVSRTAMRTPSAVAVSSPSLEQAWGEVVDNEPAQKRQDQDQDHRRDVDPAEIRQKIAERPQRRLSDPVEKMADDRGDAVVAVDDADGEEP